MFGDIVRETHAEIVKDGHLNMRVTDEHGLHLFEVTLVTTTAPAAM